VAEQTQPDINQVLSAVAGELQTLRQQTASQQAALARLAQEREAASRAAATPKPGPGELAQVNDRFLDELGRNPLRVFSEFQAATKEATKAEIRAELERERAQATAVAQATQYAEAVLQQNPDLAGHRYQLAEALDAVTASRPDLAYAQRVQEAVRLTREVVEAERVRLKQQWAAEEQQRRLQGMPSGGAYGMGSGARGPVSDEEARFARMQATLSAHDAAMRGSYPRGGGRVGG
jgi:hypothetical protein